MLAKAREDAVPPTRFKCYQCLVDIAADKRRNHVNLHILKSLLGVHEELAGEPVRIRVLFVVYWC